MVQNVQYLNGCYQVTLPIEYQTLTLSGIQMHSISGVRYSDVSAIKVFAIQIPNFKFPVYIKSNEKVLRQFTSFYFFTIQ